ncbi:MAG: SIMPL domain-containing protein [Candidatus Taylorbacteria bacterium]|nr:SIMPL domain-containing protein [Candidatus Taylorbacteria bacterium]
MNNNNYKYLIWAGTAALVMLTVFLVTVTKQVKNTATNTNTISFSGEGKVFAQPDIAAISFSILTEAKTSKAAQDDNSNKSKKVVDFLKSQGIEDKDIKTTGYNVYPQYSYQRPCPPMLDESGITYPCIQDDQQKISGYQVSQSFEVKIRDLDKVSAILDGLVTAGANQVNQLGFKIDDEEKIKEQAREMAIKDAKEKAAKLRKQLGIRLGKIVNYQEGGGGYPIYMLKAEAADGRGGDVSSPEVPPGENEIVVNVTITYQIK